jgi:hypothetical protein
MKLNEILNEVEIVSTRNKNRKNGTWIDPDEQQALTDNKTIRVYHGVNDLRQFIHMIQHGLSGNTKIDRRYSYENDNNPKGLFVTPDLEVAKEFGSYVIEFHTKVSDLEAPVWPGGSYTVQGGMEQFWKHDGEREEKRLADRERISNDEQTPSPIRKSDRPELAASFFTGESQALFTGDLDPNSIRAVWISDTPQQSGKYSNFTRYDRKSALAILQKDGFSGYGGKKVTATDKDLLRNKKFFEPRDVASVELLMKRLKRKRLHSKLDMGDIVKVLKRDSQYLKQITWSDRQAQELTKDLENY